MELRSANSVKHDGTGDDQKLLWSGREGGLQQVPLDVKAECSAVGRGSANSVRNDDTGDDQELHSPFYLKWGRGRPHQNYVLPSCTYFNGFIFFCIQALIYDYDYINIYLYIIYVFCESSGK